MRLTQLAGPILTAAFVVLTPATASDEKDVLDSAIGMKNHTIFVTALRESGVADRLREKGPYTIFAPTDAAFRKLGDDEIRDLLKDKERLRGIVINHIVEGRFTSAELLKLEPKQVKSLGGSTFKFGFKNGAFEAIGNAIVVKADIKCSNGVIHVIDTVLVPAK